MVFDWRKFPPVFVPALSRAYLTSQDRVFWLGDGELLAEHPQPPHWHDTYEIGLILNGSGFLVVDDHSFPYETGQIYIIDDSKPHMGYSETACTALFVVHFQPALLNESWIAQIRTETQFPFIPDFSGASPLIPQDDPVTSIVSNLLQAIRLEGESQDHAWEVVVSGLILQVMGHLTRRLLKQPNRERLDLKRREALQRIRPILHLVETHFAEPLTLEEMSKTAYLSRSHCCSLFQTALNTTPVAYRNRKRLSEARRLLFQTTLPVRAIAFQVGFSSTQEFNRLFVREYHVTPTQFRQHNSEF
jgi:AraC family transcriptional regulator, melibiose operon regulatory protein